MDPTTPKWKLVAVIVVVQILCNFKLLPQLLLQVHNQATPGRGVVVNCTKDIVEKEKAVTNPNPFNNSSMLVFTLSHPLGAISRNQQRELCRPLYDSHKIKHFFVVGKPSYDDRPRDEHVQGQLYTVKEQRAALELMTEHEKFGE